jgi:CHAT domain-containing protein/tetratricopeptide (TPR) repeat protein
MNTRLFNVLAKFSVSVLLTCSLSVTLAAQVSETEVSVPKGIQDIVSLIKQTDIDTKSRDADIKLISEKIATDAPIQDKYVFYYLQALAADRLGRIDLRITFLKNAIEFAKEKSVQEFITNQELAAAEIAVGNATAGLDRLKSMIPRIPANMNGFFLSTNANVSRAYAQIGDFQSSEKYLREVDSVLTLMKRYNSYPVYGFNWNRNFFQTNAELEFQKGRFLEAEISFRKAIGFLESGIVDHEKRFMASGQGLGVPGMGSDTNTGSPNQMKAGLEYLYLKLSDTLLKLRKVNEAEYFSREALKKSLSRTGKASLTTTAALRQLSIVMLSRERNKDAIYLLNQGLQGLQEAGVTSESIQLAVTKKTLASALIADNRYADALKIYSELEVTLKTYPETAKFVDIASPDRVLAFIQTGDLASAENAARHLVTLNEARTGKSSKTSTQAKLLLAVTLSEQRKDEAALTLFASSINDLVEQEREASADSDGISTKEKKFLAGYVESYLGVLSRSFEKNPNPKLISEAFVLGDLARSSNVQRALSASTARANITNPRLSKLVREEQDLNQQIIFLTKFSKELAMQPASEQLPQIQAKMKTDIEQLRKDAKRATMLIGLDFPEYAELVNPKPITLEKIQKTIKSNETLITWFVGTKTSYVWAVNQQGTPLFKALPVGQKEVRTNVTQLRKALDPGVATIDAIPEFDFKLAGHLYETLFKPVDSAFAGKDTLVVVPHDEIGQLPLGVLTTAPFQTKAKTENLFANYKEAPWLIRKYAIVNSPSVTALNSLRGLPEPKKDRLDFIGFGDPLFSVDQAKLEERKMALASVDTNKLASRGVPLRLRNTPKTADVSSAEVSMLPRLPDTNEEILEISKVFNVKPERDIFLQKRANLQEVLKVDMSNRKVVMFSTHGLVPGELDGLNQPALALTNPEVQNLKGDGLLTVDTILTMKLDADWVVLSACNTAAGEGEGAEALSGLGRAFFFAGARAILVSSWPVDSEASRKLMTDLFKRYVQEKGVSKPRALQQASLHLLDEGVPDDQKAKYTYSHPLFWGPFTMVGN